MEKEIFTLYGNDDVQYKKYDNSIDINITNQNVNDNTNMMGYDQMGGTSMMGMVTSPVVEPGRERVVYRNIYHTVPHE